MTVANLKMKNSTKGDGKRDVWEKCGSILPGTPMTHERGWDRQKKRKIHESGCPSDSQYMNKSCQKKTSLKKEKESPCATTATIDEGCTTSLTDGQISPTKALRAAQLKKRFADLIFKANHQSVMPQGDKVDPLKLQQERERLQKQQIAEKARIEEQIKVAEAVLRIRAEAELKMQRQREREAARIALEKMEKTVEFNDGVQIMRDFESLLNSVC